MNRISVFAIIFTLFIPLDSIKSPAFFGVLDEEAYCA